MFHRILNFYTMARISHEQPTNESNVERLKPAKHWMTWDSGNKCLKYWDSDAVKGIENEEEKKEKGNAQQHVPFKFSMFCEFSTVKGWHADSNSRIYSNEVAYIGSQPITVSSFDGGKLIEGIYSEIKPKVLSLGGKFHKSVYGVSDNGTPINLAFKGSVVSAWSDFVKESGEEVYNKWIHIDSFKEMKKGNIEWTVPVFALGKPFTAKENEMIVSVSQDTKNALASRDVNKEAEAVLAQMDLSI